MASVCKLTAKEVAITDIKIEIRDLYKVFGNNPEAAMKHVHAGISKQDLLDNHGHVLGLRNINVKM